MIDSKASGAAVALAVVALIAGILIGIVGAGVYDLEDTNDSESRSETISSSEVEFLTTLQERMLGVVDLSRAWQQSTYDERGDSATLKASWEEARDELNEILGAYLPEDDASSITDTLSEYQAQVIEYVRAAREDEVEALTVAETAMEEAQNELALVIAEIAGEDEAIWQERTGDLHEHILQALTSYVAGNFEESYRAARAARSTAAELAHELTQVIIDTHPERF